MDSDFRGFYALPILAAIFVFCIFVLPGLIQLPTTYTGNVTSTSMYSTGFSSVSTFNFIDGSGAGGLSGVQF